MDQTVMIIIGIILFIFILSQVMKKQDEPQVVSPGLVPYIPSPIAPQVVPPDLHIPVPDTTSPLDDFTSHSGVGCKGRNELGAWSDLYNVRECATKCKADPRCISFDYNDGTGQCQHSTTCTADIATSYPEWGLYTKSTFLDFFKGYPNKSCIGRNELGIWKNNEYSLNLCAAKCFSDPKCVSFEYKHDGTCHHSSTCTPSLLVDSNNYHSYIKK